ncbi:MAG: hypothetical protein ACR2FK_07275, partial [Sphingomicrobium sp.]
MAGLLRGAGWIFVGATERQRRRAAALIQHSSLFEHDWYLDQYPDVADSGVDPARHYLDFGWREGRDPSPGFSTTAYLRANSDVATLGVNPLLHYVEHGHAEGRGAPDHAAPARLPMPPLKAFGPAAPCARFALDVDRAVRWTRSGNTSAATGEDMMLGGYFIGRFRDAASRLDVEAALALLARLSGSAEPSSSQAAEGRSLVMTLLDCWHTGLALLRTRWRGDHELGPIVVRALQHYRGEPTLVGEGLIRGDLDA